MEQDELVQRTLADLKAITKIGCKAWEALAKAIDWDEEDCDEINSWLYDIGNGDV